MNVIGFKIRYVAPVDSPTDAPESDVLADLDGEEFLHETEAHVPCLHDRQMPVLCTFDLNGELQSIRKRRDAEVFYVQVASLDERSGTPVMVNFCPPDDEPISVLEGSYDATVEGAQPLNAEQLAALGPSWVSDVAREMDIVRIVSTWVAVDGRLYAPCAQPHFSLPLNGHGHLSPRVGDTHDAYEPLIFGISQNDEVEAYRYGFKLAERSDMGKSNASIQLSKPLVCEIRSLLNPHLLKDDWITASANNVLKLVLESASHSREPSSSRVIALVLREMESFKDGKRGAPYLVPAFLARMAEHIRTVPRPDRQVAFGLAESFCLAWPTYLDAMGLDPTEVAREWPHDLLDPIPVAAPPVESVYVEGWNNLSPRRDSLVHAVHHVMANAFQNSHRFDMMSRSEQRLWKVRSIVDAFGTDLRFLKRLEDQAAWNMEALGQDAEGNPLRRPRLAIRIELTIKDNLSVVLHPYVTDAGVSDFLRLPFALAVPTSHFRPRGELAFVRDVGDMFDREETGTEWWSLLGSDLRALVKICFDNLVARIERKFEVVREDNIVATVIKENHHERVTILRIVDKAEADEDARLERERSRIVAEQRFRNSRRQYLDGLKVDPVALAHVALTYDDPQTRRKDIIDAFGLAGIRTDWGDGLKGNCDTLLMALEENRPGWRDAAYEPLPIPVDGGRKKPGRKPKPKVELPPPKTEKGFNVVGLMAKVNKLRSSKGQPQIPREQWPTTRKEAGPLIEEVAGPRAR